MARDRTIPRGQQEAAERRAAAVEAEKVAKCCGTAKVHLDHLVFDELNEREHDVANEEFLVECFRRQGCVPSDPIFHIPAVVEHQDLERALSHQRLSSTELGRGLAPIPSLRFTSDVRIRCLLGRHRVDAARKCLQKDQQWWVIEMYPTGEPASIRHRQWLTMS